MKNPAKETARKVARLASEHPEKTYEELARELGISRITLIKYLKLAGYTRQRGRKPFTL
jgi:response regulator of citrate/malate metabolism